MELSNSHFEKPYIVRLSQLTAEQWKHFISKNISLRDTDTRVTVRIFYRNKKDKRSLSEIVDAIASDVKAVAHGHLTDAVDVPEESLQRRFPPNIGDHNGHKPAANVLVPQTFSPELSPRSELRRQNFVADQEDAPTVVAREALWKVLDEKKLEMLSESEYQILLDQVMPERRSRREWNALGRESALMFPQINSNAFGISVTAVQQYIKSDLLLIYQIDRPNKLIYLLRIGSHSDLF